MRQRHALKATSSVFQERVQARVQALGGEPTVLAERAGLQRNFIYDITNRGTKTGVRAQNLDKLAKALECDPRYLLGEIDTPWPHEGQAREPEPAGVDGPAFAGICWPGMWQSLDAPPPRRHAPLLATDPRYPDVPQVYYRLEGGVMLDTGGDAFAIGIESAQFTRAVGPIGNGSVVVLRRVRRAQQEAELSVRLVEKTTGETKLADITGSRPPLTLENPPNGEDVSIDAVVTIAVQLTA
jgi:DNA-binding Xre family transcriptional regulator